MAYLEQALREQHAKISNDGKKITYLAVNHTEKYTDPEEKVRAEFWAELIYRYQYQPQRIGEVKVPRRTPNDYADLVVYQDDERKSPYIVIECKRDGITDAEFNQSIEQAVGNRASLSASYVGVIAGSTRRFAAKKWFEEQLLGKA